MQIITWKVVLNHADFLLSQEVCTPLKNHFNFPSRKLTGIVFTKWRPLTSKICARDSDICFELRKCS